MNWGPRRNPAERVRWGVEKVNCFKEAREAALERELRNE